MKNTKLSALLNTPLGVVIAVGAVVLGVELLFMVVLHEFLMVQFKLSDDAWDFVDAITLLAVVTPVLYFLVFRRMRESEERLRKINAAALNAIVIVNEQGRIADWNLAAQKMFQYSQEEAVGQQMHQLIAPPHYRDDAARGFASFEETGGGPLIGKITEITALRKDGSEFPIELSLAAVKLKGRWHAIGVIRDITERKQAENALRETKHELQEFFDLVPDMVCIVSAPDGCLQQVNNAWETILGFTTDELIGKPFTDFIHPDDVAPTLAEVEKQLAGQLTHSFTNRYRSKDGSYKWLEWDATPAKNKLLYAAARDITERKRTEELMDAQFAETLRARLEWQAVFDSISQPIFLHDDEFRITRANLAYAKAAGMEVSDVIGQPYWKIFPRSEGPMASCTHAQRSHKEESEELKIGKEIYHSRAFLADYSPTKQYAVHILENITERKLAEAKLAEHTEELRRWHDITMGREMRTLELKREINELLGQAGQPPRYLSVEQSDAE